MLDDSLSANGTLRSVDSLDNTATSIIMIHSIGLALSFLSVHSTMLALSVRMIHSF